MCGRVVGALHRLGPRTLLDARCWEKFRFLEGEVVKAENLLRPRRWGPRLSVFALCLDQHIAGRSHRWHHDSGCVWCSDQSLQRACARDLLVMAAKGIFVVVPGFS